MRIIRDDNDCVSLAEEHLCQCMQSRQQAGPGSHCTAGNLPVGAITPQETHM